MPVVNRIDWILRQIDMGRKVHISVGEGLDKHKVKYKMILADPDDGPMSPPVASALSSILLGLRCSVQLNPAVDRGHKHSDKISVISIWIKLKNHDGLDPVGSRCSGYSPETLRNTTSTSTASACAGIDVSGAEPQSKRMRIAGSPQVEYVDGGAPNLRGDEELQRESVSRKKKEELFTARYYAIMELHRERVFSTLHSLMALLKQNVFDMGRDRALNFLDDDGAFQDMAESMKHNCCSQINLQHFSVFEANGIIIEVDKQILQFWKESREEVTGWKSLVTL